LGKAHPTVEGRRLRLYSPHPGLLFNVLHGYNSIPPHSSTLHVLHCCRTLSPTHSSIDDYDSIPILLNFSRDPWLQLYFLHTVQSMATALSPYCSTFHVIHCYDSIPHTQFNPWLQLYPYIAQLFTSSMATTLSPTQSSIYMATTLFPTHSSIQGYDSIPPHTIHGCDSIPHRTVQLFTHA
jgi:hypothetical protein